MRIRTHRLAVVWIVLLLAAAVPAPAQEEEQPAKTSGAATDLPWPDDPPDLDIEVLEKLRQIIPLKHPFGRRIQRYIGKAAEHVDEGDPEEAEELLERVQRGRLNPFERANVLRMAAFIAYGDSRAEDAIRYFNRSLETEAWQRKEEAGLRYAIAQLCMSIGDWERAIAWFQSWLRYAKEPDPNGYYIMAIAYFQMKDVEAAIEHTQKAIEASPPAREPWLRLLSALYAGAERYDEAVPILEELVVRFPKKQYWTQLSLIYAARDDYPRALAAQQLAHAQGFLSEDKELVRLARSYLYHETPLPAAQLLREEIEAGRIEDSPEHYELLANSWIASREFDAALPPLRMAAERAEHGNLYLRLGQVYMQREQWDVAASMFQKAIDKGELDKPGNAVLLIGISLYNGDQVARAESYFQRARGFEATRAEAERWLEHVSRELGNAQDAADSPI